MDLYLIRHADSVPLGERGITKDDNRPLSELGENQALILGQNLKGRGLEFDKVVVSPLLRARQTADIMLKAWSRVPELATSGSLVPEADPKDTAGFLCQQAGTSIALVGHMPHLGHMTAWLIGSKKARIDLDKAGAAHVYCSSQLRKGAGTLIWLVTFSWVELGRGQ